MVNQRNIEAFINYNYKPFSKTQCIKRILLMWGIGFAVCLIGLNNFAWLITIGCLNILISVGFAHMLFKPYSTPKTRFLCDGIFYLHISVLLCLVSYRIMAWKIGSNIWLLVILLGLWLVCISLFAIIVLINIRCGRYSNHIQSPKSFLFPFISGLLGMLVARIFLHNASQRVAILLVCGILLLLSFLLGVGSLNLLKVILINKTGGQGDGPVVPSQEPK